MKDIWTDADYNRRDKYSYAASDYAWHRVTLDEHSMKGIRAWGLAGTRCNVCHLHFEQDEMIYEMPLKYYGYYCRDCMTQFTW